jgi:tryptophanyl-tRNA synthetase
VDYHAMTMPYVPNKLRENTWDLITNLVASGIEPENLFVQSLVPEHAELAWVFSCFCSYGQLTRMTQFKDKSQQSKSAGKEDFVSAGLLTYPILQAADILIYKADYVPVGKDQEQHLELTRDIAQRFNNQVGKEYFILPEGLYTEAAKIRSTADPTRKMSKSAGEKHYISVFAAPDKVRKQIQSAVTDTGAESKGSMSEGVENLFLLLKASGSVSRHEELMQDYNNGVLKYSDLKAAVGDSLVDMLTPIQERKKELLANKKELRDRVKQSSELIRKRAQQTIREVKELSGLINVRM